MKNNSWTQPQHSKISYQNSCGKSELSFLVIGYPGSISNHIRLNGLVVKAIEEITNSSSKSSHTTGSSSAFYCLKTNKGQTRFLLRAALKHHWILNICESAKTFPEINLFYRKDALILQEAGSK